MLQPFEKGKKLLDQAIPIAELMKRVTSIMKEVEEAKGKHGRVTEIS